MNERSVPAIDVHGLVKNFGGVRAVAGVDFTVFQGELFGFLGPNGAGKTTTINMLTGLARPYSGTIHIAGINCSKDSKAAQHLMGVVPDESNLYPELTGFENLCFCAALYGMRKKERTDRARELLSTFGLTDAAHRKFSTYSKGMKRKLTIAAGIAHRPQILFLDEPTTGIDVASARQVRQLVADLHKEETTIFLTTHYIEEAERLCDRIAFIVSGKIVRIESVEKLLQPIQNRQVVRISLTNMKKGLLETLRTSFSGIDFDMPREGVIRAEPTDAVQVGPIIRLLEDCGAQVYEARRIRPSLEDVFVRITGIEADAMQKEKERRGKEE
ncbi:MAG: ABC transporter ATP-binding protein [Thermovirgaceae bacterium]